MPIGATLDIETSDGENYNHRREIDDEIKDIKAKLLRSLGGINKKTITKTIAHSELHMCSELKNANSKHIFVHPYMRHSFFYKGIQVGQCDIYESSLYHMIDFFSSMNMQRDAGEFTPGQERTKKKEQIISTFDTEFKIYKKSELKLAKLLGPEVQLKNIGSLMLEAIIQDGTKKEINTITRSTQENAKKFYIKTLDKIKAQKKIETYSIKQTPKDLEFRVTLKTKN